MSGQTKEEIEYNEILRNRIAVLLAMAPEGMTTRRLAYIMGETVHKISSMINVMIKRKHVWHIDTTDEGRVYALRKYG